MKLKSVLCLLGLLLPILFGSTEAAPVPLDSEENGIPMSYHEARYDLITKQDSAKVMANLEETGIPMSYSEALYAFKAKQDAAKVETTTKEIGIRIHSSQRDAKDRHALKVKQVQASRRLQKKAASSSSNNGGGYSADAVREATREELGAFPKSVHKLWARRGNGWEPTPPIGPRPPALPAHGGAVAICLTVVDSLPHEELWRRWLPRRQQNSIDRVVADNHTVESSSSSSSGSSSSSSSSSNGGGGTKRAVSAGGGSGVSAGYDRTGHLYIHAKHPEVLAQRQPWTKARTLPHSYRPEWNDVKVARAMLALLRHALEDDPFTQFIYLGTESCVPITPFAEAADVLWAQGAVSWVPLKPRTSSRRWNRTSSQFAQVDPKVVPRSAVWKALPGWVFLARHHAQAIVDLESRVGGELWPAFAGVFAPEEIFFPTMLALAGYAPRSSKPPRPAPVPAAPAAPAGGDGSGAAAAATAAAAAAAAVGVAGEGRAPGQSSPVANGAASTWAPPEQQVRVQPLVYARYPTSGKNRANPVALDEPFDRRMLQELRQGGFLIVRKFKRPICQSLQKLMVGGKGGEQDSEVLEVAENERGRRPTKRARMENSRSL